ncbi:hypothetical protein PCE1_003045 [Barthelona sp. PCE]
MNDANNTNIIDKNENGNANSAVANSGSEVVAIGLYSGGLDSALSIKLIQQQGIRVVAFHLTTVFTGSTNDLKAPQHIIDGAEELGVELHVVQDTDTLLQLVLNPPHGYGKNVNPCIDCRRNTIKLGVEYMREIGASFIFSGEVVGQRPFSQRMTPMMETAVALGVEDILLRPLCAHQLPETQPEKDGIVDRSKLMNISGRSRKTQLRLAKEFGITKFGSPSGGCSLTEPSFGNMFKKWGINHFNVEPTKEHGFAVDIEDINCCSISNNDLLMLRLGRRLFVPNEELNTPGYLVTCGRKQEENVTIMELSRMRHRELLEGSQRGFKNPDIIIECLEPGAIVMCRPCPDALFEILKTYESDDVPLDMILAVEGLRAAFDLAVYQSHARKKEMAVVDVKLRLPCLPDGTNNDEVFYYVRDYPFPAENPALKYS